MGAWPYDYAWEKFRAAYVATHPLCRMCEQMGKVTDTEVVDHIIRVREAPERRLDPTNCQPLCKLCHDSIKRTQEQSGYLKGAGIDGRPLDPNHRWNQ